MFEEDKDDKIYNLIISNGMDINKEYAQFTEKLFSKTDFLWKESISPDYATAGKEFFQKVEACHRRWSTKQILKLSQTYRIGTTIEEPPVLRRLRYD